MLTTRMQTALLLTIRTGVLLVLLTPLVVTTGTFFPFIVGKALYARSIIEVIFGLWLVLAYRYPAYRPPRSWVLLAFGVWLVVSLLAGVAGVSFQRSLWSTYERMQGIIDLAHWFAFALVVTSVFRSLMHWRHLLNFNLGVSLLMALLGVLQNYQVDATAIPFLGDCLQPGRARLDICLGNPTFVGAYMLVNVLIAAGFLFQSAGARPATQTSPTRARRRRRRGAQSSAGISSLVWWQLVWVIVIGFDLWMLILSGSRGAAIGLVAGVAALPVGYVVWGQLPRLRNAALYGVVILAVLAISFTLVRNTTFIREIGESNVLVRRLSTISPDDPNIKGRFASWSAGLKGFLSRPLLGWGPENYIVASGRYFSAESGSTETFDQAHNKLLEELTTKGVLGFLTYLALWALMFRVVVRRVRRRDADQQLLMLFIGAAMTGYFVQNLFLFDTPATVLLFILLLAFMVNLETTIEGSAVEPLRSSQGAPRGSVIEETGEPELAWHGRWLGSFRTRWGSSPAVSRARALGGAEALRSDAAVASGLIVVLALVVLGVYFLNYRPYKAAKAVLETQQARTWDEVLVRFDDAIDTFPPLANYPRFILLTTATRNWENLTEEEQRATLAMAEREAGYAFKSEPEGWRIYASLAGLYQRASSLDSKYLEEARVYVKKVTELAPETAAVLALQAQQQLVEEADRNARDAKAE